MRKRPPYCFVLLLCGLFWALPASTQVYTKARALTVNDSLADNRVTCFYKDRTGFVWIGTRNGLNRYDGHRMKTFRPAAGNSISNEVINDIAEDSRGNIWVATMDGLNVYDPVADKWTSLLPGSDPSANDIPSNLIWDIHVDAKDRVWIASDVHQFCFYQPATKKFTYYNWPAFVKNNPRFANGNYNSIKRFVFKNEREILIASNKCLVGLNTETKAFTYIGGNYRSDVWDLRYDSFAGKAYVSIEKGRLLVWDEKKATVTDTVPRAEPYPSTQFFLPSAKEIWMASEPGLIRIDPDKNRFALERNVPQLAGSLQPGGVAAVLQAKDGVNWVGTSNGISVYDTECTPSLFLPLVAASDKESTNEMGGAWFDKQHNRYFVCATVASAVFVVDGKTGRVQKITADDKGWPLRRCNAVKADNENNIWLLTDDHVYRYDEATASFRLFPTPNNGAVVVFRDVAQDAEGNLWFGSFHSGLYYYRTREQRFSRPAGKGFENVLTVTALHADNKRKAVWIGTFSIGFYRYDLEQKRLDAFLETEQHPEYAALNLVQDVTQDAEGRVWAATQAGGLFRFTDKGYGRQDITQFTMKNGLDNNSFAALRAGRDNLLWTLSGNGLSAMSVKGEKPVVSRGNGAFSFSSYVSDVRFPHRIFYNEAANEVLVGVAGGLLLHRPDNGKPGAAIPVVLTAVSVNGQALPAAQVSTNAQRTLSSDENNLVFEFARLYYGLSTGYTTEYRLSGQDDVWVHADERLLADYQNLSPGLYCFEVRVKDAQGRVAGVCRSAAFRIQPPFWKRWWAVGLMLALVALLVYAIFRRRVNAIRQQAAVKQQLAELEAKALRAQMNPHFIFNSLNAIQELIVTQNVDAAYNYLSKFSKLLRQVLNHSEKAAIPLADELQMLRLYLELESLRFRGAFSYRIDVDEAIDPENAMVPPLLLQPFVENALWHGLMPKEGEKKVRLRVLQNGDGIVCTIEDNGIGRKRAGEIKAQKIGAQHFESKGLRLSQQRIQLLNLDGGKGFVKIEDLYNDNVAAGTRVSVHLPYIQR